MVPAGQPRKWPIAEEIQPTIGGTPLRFLRRRRGQPAPFGDHSGGAPPTGGTKDTERWRPLLVAAQGPRVPCCGGPGHRHRTEGCLGPQCATAGGKGPSRALVGAGADPQQPAALRAGVPVRARQRRGTGGRRLDHRRRLGGAQPGPDGSRREHGRRAGRRRDPHPSRPLRPGRPGPGGLGSLGRTPPGRCRPCCVAATSRPTTLWSGWRAAGISGVPADKRPTSPTPPWRSGPSCRWPQPDVLSRTSSRLELPGWDFRAVWTPALPRPHLPLLRPAQRSCSPATMCSPASPPTSRSTASSTPTRSATTSSRWPSYGPSIPTRCCPPTSTASPALGERVDAISSTTPSGWRPSSRRWPRSRGSRLGPHAVPGVVAPVGRHPELHAASGQRRDPGTPRPARGQGAGAPPGRRAGPLLSGGRPDRLIVPDPPLPAPGPAGGIGREPDQSSSGPGYRASAFSTS